VPSPGAAPVRHRSIESLPPSRVDESLLRGLRVLVVDDEEDALMLLETALTQHGADVTTASNAADALAAIERHPPDMLLSDIGMPYEDGYSLIREVRSRPHARGGGIPAIAITAYASASDRLAVEAAGFQAHIAKPFEVSEVARLVAALGHATGSRS
jgi:CheY-like chemotaxis protein